MSIRRRSDPRAVVLGAFVAFALLAPAVARAQEAPAAPADAMEPLRERFREGMDQYRAGRYGDAIVVWEQIYRELGPETGYRLSFNLGRAYDAAQDLTKAAEHYETYVAQVEQRRTRGEALEPLVEKQESDARERLAQLAATRGRIRVVPGDRPTAVQIDHGEPRLAGFVAYVAPGAHAVTFGTGEGARRRDVVVAEGQMIEIAPPAPEPPVTAQPSPPREVVPPPPTRRPPFSATWLYVAGGVTLASAVVPIVGYATAMSTRSDYLDATERREQERLASDYDDRRRFTYVSAAVTGGLAAVTGGLVAAWFLWPTTPSVSVAPDGRAASVGVTGAF